MTLLGAAGAVPEITLTSVNFSGGREIASIFQPPTSSPWSSSGAAGPALAAGEPESPMRAETALWRDCGWRSDHASVVRIAPSRDQIALMALVAALGLWLFVQLIFIELDGRRDRLTQGNQALAEKLIRVDLKVEQLAALRPAGAIRKSI